MEKLLKLKRDGDDVFLLVKWRGLEAADNSWELVQHMFAAVPRMVTSFLKSSKQAALVKEARRLLRK